MKADVSSTAETTQTQSTQVLRKSTIQAAFKELVEIEEGRLAVAPPSKAAKPPSSVTTWTALEKSTNDPLLDGWVIPAQDLSRGDLFVMEVELETDPVYRVTSILTAIQSLIKEGGDLFAGIEYQAIRSIESANRVLSMLLAGLVPVRCRAVHYRAGAVAGEPVLVHVDLLAQLTDKSIEEFDDVHVVGVTEEHLYWKDVRRVLFTGARFQVMCRLSQAGIQKSWVPVKLADVLSDVVPELGLQVQQFGAVVLSGDRGARKIDGGHEQLESALVNYGVALANGAVNARDVRAAGVMPISAVRGHTARRQAFRAVEEYVAEAVNIEIDPVTAARLRSAAVLDAGLGLDADSESAGTSQHPPGDTAEDGAILETEFVAIYW